MGCRRSACESFRLASTHRARRRPRRHGLPSSASSLPEVGGEAVLYYHPAADAAHVAQVLETAIDDRALRTGLAKAAQARAAKFTWDRTAHGIADVIKELLQ